jgi:hypothetical protein
MSRAYATWATLMGLMLVVSAARAADDPPAAPEWLARLFPWTGEPDEFAHRFQRLDAAMVPDKADTPAIAGRVTLGFLYRNEEGATTHGKARIYLPRSLEAPDAARVPLVHNAGYELDEGGAIGTVMRGSAVIFPFQEADNPMVRGPNLDIALHHAARALPFVDDARVLVVGGSAGGYTTLMVIAEAFPVNGAAPYVPPVNWGYNAAYFLHNREMARAKKEGSDQPEQPVLVAVLPLAEIKAKQYGEDCNGDAWYYGSPIAHLSTITAPVLMSCSTADILVPIDQVSRDWVRPRDPALFEPAWTSALDDLITRPEARRTLLELLPKGSYVVSVFPVPEDTQRVVPLGTGPAQGHPIGLAMPFSTDKQWNIVILDEGPIDPKCSHSKYAVGMQHLDFERWALAQPLRPEQLTAPKLERLMKRLTGVEQFAYTFEPEGRAEPLEHHSLDFPDAERADVLRGLRTFAQRDDCAKRLSEIYGALPDVLKALGPTLGATPDEMRARLGELAKPAAPQ